MGYLGVLGDSPSPSEGSDSLAAMLCPVLREVCGGRLSPVQWFKSAWQAGGAATGTARYRLRNGREIDVVVKLPVGPREHAWTVGVGGCPDDAEAHDGPTPRVVAAGTELGGYDLAWLVVEKLGGHPLSASLDAGGVEGLLHAAAEWYKAAAEVRKIGPTDEGVREDWAGLIAKGREAVREHAIDEGQRWNEALRHAQKALPRVTAIWESRPIHTWCHGDLHPGNAMRRAGGEAGSGGRCVLIDLALVHPGHWVEDALYLERLYWAKPELLCGVKPVGTLARHLRELGMSTDEDYGLLAHARRVLMAASVPAFLNHEGHPRYVHAALEVLERTLPLVGGR